MRGAGRLARLGGCDPDHHQPAPPSPMVLCAKLIKTRGAVTHRCVLVMPSSLATVMDSLDCKSGSRGSSVGIPMIDCRDLRRGFARSQVCREVIAEGWGMVSLDKTARGDWEPGGKAGGKGTATELRTGRGPVALGVLPLAPPACPCHPLPDPCLAAPSLPHLPCSSALVSRDFPQSACSNSSSTSSVQGERAWEGGWHWDALQLPLCPLPGLSLCILGEETSWTFFLVCANRPAISPRFHCSSIAHLHAYMCNRYVPRSLAYRS